MLGPCPALTLLLFLSGLSRPLLDSCNPEQADFSLPSMECKEPYFGSLWGWGPHWKPSECPWRLTCKAVFQTERRSGGGLVAGDLEALRLWPPCMGGGRAGGSSGVEREDEPGRSKGPGSGAEADLPWHKPEQKLFVSYRKSPSLTGVKVRKSISFGLSLQSYPEWKWGISA